MNYEQLFARSGQRVVRAALIGAGVFGTSILAQSRELRRLELRVICDRDPDASARACLEAGIPPSSLSVCSDAASARTALEQGRHALLADPATLDALALDVVMECTGDPEAGARHAEAAIRHGRHVVMVTKESDAVVGPYLHALAAERGVVYTPADGDQHGLLAGLHGWARALGFAVIAGGKARESDLVVDEADGTVRSGRRSVKVDASELSSLARAAPGKLHDQLASRERALRAFQRLRAADVCELVIAANHTGLAPERPELRAPWLRLVEAPEAFSLAANGGLLSRPGAIELFGCLRRADEPSIMGGVFLVIECRSRFQRELLRAKGMLMNAAGTAALVWRPLHLLGAEAPLSALCAGLAGLSTGSPEVRPRFDVAGRLLRPLSPGTLLGKEQVEDGSLVEPLMLPASPCTASSPLPLYMACGCTVNTTVPAGSLLEVRHVDPPRDSRLWEIRSARRPGPHPG